MLISVLEVKVDPRDLCVCDAQLGIGNAGS